MPETTLEPIAPDEAVRLYLRDRQDELADATIDSYRYKLEELVEWCEAIGGVEQDLHNKALSPSLNDGDRERDVLLDADAATEGLAHLARFEYASLQHALSTVLWRCGARSGTVRSFDVRDHDRETQWFRAKHRAETPLKSKEKGERLTPLILRL